jgi:bla regulator protein BlaR1
MALANNTSKAGYISALVSCEEYQAGPAYAMAFPGQKKYLVDRVKRLVTNRNHSLDVFEKTLLTICLVMSGLCFSAYAEREQIKQVAHKVIQALAPAVDKKQQQGLDKQNALLTDQHKLVQRNADMLSSAHHITAINPIDTDRIPTMISKNNNADSLHLTYGLNVKMNGLNVNYHYKYTNKERTNYEVDTIGYLNHKGDTIRHINVHANINTKVNPTIIMSAEPKITVNANPNGKLQKLGYLDSAKHYQKLGKLYAAQPIAAHKPYGVKRIDYKLYNSDEDKARRDGAINDMLKDGLIKSRDNLSFKISNKELIINYQKQPEEVFQKYKAKYVKNTTGEWSWMYNYDSDKKTETNTVIDKSHN